MAKSNASVQCVPQHLAALAQRGFQCTLLRKKWMNGSSQT